MAAPTVYRSTDTSAPVLTGQVGSLISLLDACLVNGYDTQPAAGWSKAFSGTNAASYKQGAASGADCYLDVNDNAAGAGSAQESTVRGYEAMTAVATGTNPFPTTAQQASPGLFIRKSSTASSTARAWVLIADDKTFHLFIQSGDLAGAYQAFSFGEVYSFQSADAYRAVIAGHTATGGSSSTGLNTNALGTSATSTTAGWYLPRVAAGTGTSVNPGLFGVGTSMLATGFVGPNALDSKVYLSRLFVSNDATQAGGLRGYLRGVWQMVTGATGVADGDTFSGTGDFAGRTFLVLSFLRIGSSAVLALETTAWDTSS